MKILLLPFSWVYHFVVFLRHLFFDIGLLRVHSFDLPIIGVGNLSVGGTGKTPHIEYLIRLLKQDFRIATLSRGYGRTTKGFILAGVETKAGIIGDEPRQFSLKFPEVSVAVDEDRVHGVSTLLKSDPTPELILLDDAFQHRYIKAGLNLLLTDYHQLYTEDYLLPAGRLRDSKAAARRADIIIVTKTPNVFSPFIAEDLRSRLKPLPHQRLFFSFIKYGNFEPLRQSESVFVPKSVSSILLVTGIANPYPLKEFLLSKCTELLELAYPDHHIYSEKDFHHIVNTFESIIGKNKLIITTEKDAVRFRDSDYFRIIEKLPVFYVPIEVGFHKNQGYTIDEMINDYVRKNSRNH